MDTLARLLKKHKLVKLCRAGAWILIVIGSVHVAVLVYNAWQIYRQFAENSIQTLGGPSVPTGLFLTYLPSLFSVFALSIFYCIALYSASVVFEALSAPTAKERGESAPESQGISDEEIAYTSLKPEELAQSKRANHS